MAREVGQLGTQLHHPSGVRLSQLQDACRSACVDNGATPQVPAGVSACTPGHNVQPQDS